MRHPKFSRHAAVLGLAALLVAGLGVTTRGQHTPDPYNIVGDGNLGYETFMYPTYPNGAGFDSNQGVLQGRSGLSRSNQFQSYLNELDGVGGGTDTLFGTSSRGRGGIAPYYRAHHQFDEVFNRIYTPNEEADKTYRKDQNSRTEKYLEYLREADPKKRAQLYRAYNQQSLRSARDFGSGSTRAALRNAGTERSSASPAPSPLPSRSTTNLTPRASLLAPSRGATRSGGLPTRRPSSLPSTSAGLLNTPEQILMRSELMDRANRATAPVAGSLRTTPVPAPAPR